LIEKLTLNFENRIKQKKSSLLLQQEKEYQPSRGWAGTRRRSNIYL